MGNTGNWDPSKYFVDFTGRTNLTSEDITSLNQIQNQFLPLERVPMLTSYRITDMITEDDYQTMTGIPFIML